MDADIEEEESYNNGTLDQFNSSLLLNVDATFGGDDEAQFEVENELLELGQKYRIIAIAKKVNPTPPTICPVINIASDTEVTAVNNVGSDVVADFDINYAITNFAPSTVATVSIDTSTNPKIAGVAQTDNFITDTGMYTYQVTWVGGFVNDPVTIIMDIEVTLVNGCTYNYTANHVVFPLLASTTQDDADVNAN